MSSPDVSPEISIEIADSFVRARDYVLEESNKINSFHPFIKHHYPGHIFAEDSAAGIEWRGGKIIEPEELEAIVGRVCVAHLDLPIDIKERKPFKISFDDAGMFAARGILMGLNHLGSFSMDVGSISIIRRSVVNRIG